MADLGRYTFLPWLRRGVAAEITRPEGEPPLPGTDPARVQVPVSVTLNETLTRTVPLSLIGAGDVTGVDRDVVIRVSPPPGSFDVESNFFPLVEFDQADFPWRYTAAKAGADSRLTPWLSLIVLRDDEIESLVETGQRGGLAAVSVADASVLPPWHQAWAWAHAQISGAKNLSEAQVASVLDGEPARAIGRLLAARRLDPNTPYTAFMVPSYERGRLSGLG